jgi:hypothetical protein
MLVIEQLHYATTSRYNFPQTTPGEPELPERLIELSHNSMRNARGTNFLPYGTQSAEPFTERPQEDEALSLNSEALSALLTPLKPIRDETPITAIDVSSIRIGETETGVLCAVRGVIVQNEKHRYRYVRIGPFPFHITEENKKEIFILPGQATPSGFGAVHSLLLEAQSHLCNVVERWIQMSTAHSAMGNVILWDGSLTAGTASSPANVVAQILGTARKNSNSVLSFAKGTSLRFLGRRITDLVPNYESPCLFEVDDLPLQTSKTLRQLGKVYVAKLADRGYPFRVDIDRALAPESRIMAVQRLLGNELIFQGYPESLRLAHIFSTFTANDVMGIQRFVTEEYGLRIATRHSIRKTLFGPFGTGAED